MSGRHARLLLVLSLCSTWPTLLGAAEGSASAEVLRQRVVDELLRDGTSLAKMGRDLAIEPLAAGSWRLVVRDSATGRIVAEKDVTGVPTELEAAVAQLVIAARPMVAAPAPTCLADGTPERRKAEEEYEARAVGFKDVVRITATPEIVVVRSGIEPYRGKGRVPLEGKAFYTYIGRGDLADRYVRNATGRAGAMALGVLLTAGGLAFASANVHTDQDVCDYGAGDYQACRDRNAAVRSAQGTRLELGIGGAIVGAVVASIAYFSSPQPISDQEALRLGDEYNSRLRRDLGLDGGNTEPGRPREGPPPRPEQSTTLTAAPWVMGHGGGLALRLEL